MPVEDPVVAELPWLRKLARRLAADDAEDLVQETWLLARRDRPQPREGGLRPWLAQAMRNRMRSLRRSSLARQRREHEFAPPTTTAESADATTLEADVIRVVQQALGTLTDEQRQLLRDRFFSERTAVDIADELGVPSATVRTKVRRSLLQLREVLDARHGNDRARWVSAVVAVPAISKAAKTATGVTTMASTKGIIVASAVAATVAIAWFWSTSDDDVRVAAHAAQAAPPTSVSDEGLADGADVASGRTDTNGGATEPPPAGNRTPTQPAAAGEGAGLDSRPRAQSDHASAADAALRPAGTLPATRACTRKATANDCDFLTPSPLVVEDMAACGVVRYDFPAMFAQRDWTPEFEKQWLDLVGATTAERADVVAAAASFRSTLYGELEAIGAEVGVQPWDEDATLLDVVIELSIAVGDDQVSLASRIVAEERAGHREPPESIADRPVAERFVRAFTTVGGRFERALADKLGANRAHELHLAQDGWPGIRSQTGARCPE